MKKLILFSIVLITFAPLYCSPKNETWINWEKKFDRAFTNINPRKVPGRAMGIVIPSESKTELLPLSAIGFESLSHETLETVVFVMPAPKDSGISGIALPSLDFIETTFASFPVDQVLADQFRFDDNLVKDNDVLFGIELDPLFENQLACLKYILKGKISRVKILPIYIKLDDDPIRIKDVGSTIADRIKDIGRESSITLIISSNLSNAPDEPQLILMESKVLTHLRTLDIDGLIDQSPTIATSDSLLFGMMLGKWLNADHGEVLAYSQSHQLVLNIDKQTITGYAALGIASGPPYPNKIPHIDREKLLEIFDELFRSDLLAMTRQACASILDTTAAKPPSMINKQASKKWPIYVSLYDPEGNVAGQAGSYLAMGPLEETIRQYSFEAVQQAKPKINKENFAKYVVDLSVPHGFYTISQPDDLIPQLNGIIVEHRHRKDAFHPDAWRKYPDPHQLLSMICTKLRLKPWDYATSLAKIECFRVLAFNEKEPFQDLNASTRKKKKKKAGEEENVDDGLGGGGGGGAFPF